MKNLIYYIILFFPVLIWSQSTDQNYVRSTVYKTETTTALPASPAPENGLVNITYFDGLGRPIQQNAHKQSATGKDIVTHIEYDEFGRQSKEFLPYTTTSHSLNFRTDAPSRVISYYQDNYEDEYPFSEKLFESSPLNRVLRQSAPGEDWQIMLQYSLDNTIRFQYKTNASYEVNLFKANTSTNVNGQGFYTISLGNSSGDVYYPENELYKTIVTDENNSVTAEFKDKEGRIVLKRSFLYVPNNYESSFSLSTYYVYDIYGNLTYVIPPKAVESGIINTTVLDNLCYQYRYDARNRLVEKKLPGKAWEYIVYDKLDRVVATGPALSPFSDNPNQTGWLVTKYDVHGRVAYTGWNMARRAINSTERSSLQTSVNAMTNLYVARQSRAIEGIDVGYANNSTQPAITRLLTINYYDNYVYPNAPASIPTSIENQSVTDKTKGLPTGSWVRVPTTTSEQLFEMTHTFYDSKARPIRTYQKNHLEGYTQTDTKLDFIGNPEYTITKHKRLSGDTELTVREDFEYTPQGRLLEHKHKINSQTTETLSYNEYDELGQLETKKVGRNPSTPLQTVDYKYNIRGWLTDINDVDDLNDDLFTFKISYNKIVHPSSQGPYYSPLYNGNIAETYWKTSSDNILRKYGYEYDNINRLVIAYYMRPEVSSAGTMTLGSYNERIYYDKNGNITGLSRYGDLDSTVDRIIIDQLNYTYDQGNRLLKVTDNSNHPEGFNDGADNDEEYGYDDFGNMTRDDNKGIENITYNHLNLPKKITFNNSTQNISYLYNALGQKVEKKVYRPGIESYTVTTNYLNGFHYEFNDNPNMIGNNGLVFFATAEGYVNVTLGRGGYLYNYVYNYTDHLGNIRLSYTRGTGTNPPVILEENHYYPFGLKHKKYGAVDKDFVEIDDETGYYVGIDVVPPQSRKSYQYKFQGQERQDELNLNWYSFKWRNYDPAIARFFNIDPLSDKYAYQSHYNFSENRVIDGVELEGLEVVLLVDINERPADNGTSGTTYTGSLYHLNETTGAVNGPYRASSYPNSISNTNNNTSSNTLNEGTHQYNNASGHKGGTRKGLNIVDSDGNRNAPGTNPSGDDVTMTYVNVHSGASDNGNYNSRGSEGCITIHTDDVNNFFNHFNWTNKSQTTGDSTGTIQVLRGTETERNTAIQNLQNEGQQIRIQNYLEDSNQNIFSPFSH